VHRKLKLLENEVYKNIQRFNFGWLYLSRD